MKSHWKYYKVGNIVCFRGRKLAMGLTMALEAVIIEPVRGVLFAP
jgi:hypothetical protein